MSKPEVSKAPELRGRRFYTIIVVLMACLVTDYLISNIADIITEQLKTNAGIALFIVISVVTILVQLYLLRILSGLVSRKQLESLFLRKIVVITQYILIAIIIVTIFQIILFSQYFTSMLIISTTLSYGLTAILMGLLACKFLVWFKRRKNLALLLYGIGATVIVFNAISSIILFDSILMQKSQTTS